MKKFLFTLFAAALSIASFGANYNYTQDPAVIRQELADPATSEEFKTYYTMVLKGVEDPASIDTWAKFNAWADTQKIEDSFKGWYVLSFKWSFSPECYAYLQEKGDSYAIHFLLSAKARKELGIKNEDLFVTLSDFMLSSDSYNTTHLTNACNILANCSIKVNKEIVVDTCRMLYAKYLPNISTEEAKTAWNPILSKITLIAKGRGVDITK